MLRVIAVVFPGKGTGLAVEGDLFSTALPLDAGTGCEEV
jgi:hypothetical protein